MEGESKDVGRAEIVQIVQESTEPVVPQPTLQERPGLSGSSSEAPLRPSVSKPASRLRCFAKNWKDITSDPKIFSWLNGYIIPFRVKPVQVIEPKEQRWNTKEKSEIFGILDDLLKKSTINKCNSDKGHFLSDIFLVPKPDGSNRLILNLKKLNKFMSTCQFKLEDGKTVTKLMSEGDFLAKIDLKDAYYLVPIHKSCQKFLRFRFENTLLEFTCLPFGLNVVPYIFTKIMKPVVYHLRQLGLLSIIYLDDILLLGNTYNECMKNIQLTISLLEKLGFIINYKKIVLVPSQICNYLGFLYNSAQMTVELPASKKAKIANIIKLKKNQRIQIREFAKILGFLVSCCAAVNYG